MLEPVLLSVSLVPLARVPLPGAEIPAFDRVSGRLLVTSATDIHAFSLEDGSVPCGRGFIRLGASGDDVTHVACDPAGRGFVAACVVPAAFASRFGHVVFFDPVTLTEIARIGVGHNPDSCAFSPGGEFLVVANEGQPDVLPSGEVVDPPGSVTVIDLRRVRGPSDLSALGDNDAAMVMMSGPAMEAAMQSESAPRVAARNADSPGIDIEPEYVVAPDNQRAFITLQENNAIAEITLDPPTLARVVGLGVVTRELDASDHDGPLASSWAVACAPMPDQLAVFISHGRRYLAIAEEGDTRGEQRGPEPARLADVARLSDLAAWKGLDEERIGREFLDAGQLGRLHVLIDRADADGDGRVDALVAAGARSLGIYDALTLERAGDTGSALEVASMSLFADDSRSDERGPEPEGVVVGVFDGRTIAFVTLERPGAIACVDITAPTAPTVISVHPSAWDSELAPEGMCLIDTVDGRTLLIACFEASGTLVVHEVVTRFNE